MEMVCIVCPNGCLLDIEGSGDDIKVKGALCPKGIEFAKTELQDPRRALTTTVATVFGDMPRLPVRTADEIPKADLLDAMKKIKTLTVKERLHEGDSVCEDFFGTRLIATADMTRQNINL
ncbi:MAG: DUF1667 domain-containing protein [Clostridiales bacterium]|nr:DUF1667 domain-containing protein [Clostridiales bacterium]